MVVFEVFVEGISFNSVFDIGFMEPESINRIILSTFPVIGTGFAGLLAECTLYTGQCRVPPSWCGWLLSRQTESILIPDPALVSCVNRTSGKK